MRILLAVFALLFSASVSMAQSHPRPPGMAQANQAEAQVEKSMPPPQQQVRPAIDNAKLQRDADELSTLAQSIPPDITKVTQGMLPKDVIEKLKQIEKLSKRLRGELTP